MDRITITQSFMRKLTNNEFQVLVHNVFDLLGEAAIEEPHIIELIQNAEKHLEVLVDLGKKPRAHKNTKLIKELILERREQLLAIKDATDGFVRTKSEATSGAAAVLSDWLLKDRSQLGSRGINIQSGIAQRLIDEAGRNPKIAESLETLNLTESFEELMSLTNRITKLLQARVNERNEAKRKRDRRRQKCCFDLDMLFKAMQAQANMEGAFNRQDYYNLCMDIKSFLDAANAIRESRSTRSSNEKAPSEVEPETGGNETPENKSSDGQQLSND